VVPELEIEPELIAGVSARVGGVVFDNSVKSQLSRMRHAFGG
jgi:F0F1-type ATP synthase delta subunit